MNRICRVCRSLASLRRARGWWPDRNPLRRRCDRAEAAIVTVLVAVFLAGAPLLARAAGRQAHDSGPRPGQAQRARWHRVPAVLRTATIHRFAPSEALAWARWTAPRGLQASRALADGMVAVLILAELLWGAGLAARGVVDRRRLAAWDAEWRT